MARIHLTPRRWLARLAPWLLIALGMAAGDVSAEAPKGAAVFPFVDRRHADRSEWFGAFLRTGIEDALLRSGRVPLMGEEPARIWAAQLGAEPDADMPAQRLPELRVDFVVRGATQRVVDQAIVSLELTNTGPAGGSAHPAGAPGETRDWQISMDLSHQTPREALLGVLEPLYEALALGVPPDPPAQPDRWEPVQDYYALAAELAPLSPASDPAIARAPAAERDARLARAQQEPALRAKALCRLALLGLQEARVDLTDEVRRAAKLREALGLVREAIRLEPWDARRMALKGEIHYFLKEDYEARTEASVARLRNPRDGLAYVVLALVAGLSTAEGTDWMKQALASDPYLRAAGRPAGWPPFQRGALEPLLARWEQLKGEGDRWSDPSFDRQIALGEALFNARRWEEAQQTFQAAGEMDVDSHLPRLYLARILKETGDAEEAAHDLRILAAEYPQEWAVWHELGLALSAVDQFAEAEDAFRRALEERPADSDSLYHLVLAQLGRERWEAARETLAVLLERNSRHGQGWLLLGTVESRLERWPEALRAFNQALLIDPQSEKARAGLRLAQSKAGR